jgi:histidinol-phosphate aminotransferase
MTAPANLAAAAVQKIAPYIPGKPIEELEREYGVTNIIKLASNENPLGPGPLAVAAIAKAAGEIGLYPDGNGFELKQALSRRFGCGIECITLGNGSNDVLSLSHRRTGDGSNRTSCARARRRRADASGS